MKNTLLLGLALITVAPASGQIADSSLLELRDQRTYNSKTYFNPKDETFTTVVSAGYIHYQKPDRSYHDIDTRFQAEDSSKAFGMNEGLYRVRVDHHANAGRDYDVTLETPRPVREKFRDPGKGQHAATHLRWKLLSFGYLDLQQFLYRPLEFPNPIEQKVNDNRLEYPEIFYGIDLRYTCNATGLKEEFVVSDKGRERLPSPEQIGFVPEQTYLMFAFEFKLTPNNLQIFARTSSGRTRIKTHGRFAFNGEGQVEIEDEDTNLRLFLPEDFAWAEADSANENVERAKIRRYIYTERGKDYMYVGVPWEWVNNAAKGNLIIDPTTTAATNQDTRLEDASNYGSGVTLTIGKPAGLVKRRTILKFDLTGIPANATVLNAQMKLYYFSNSSTGTPIDRWVQAHQLLVDWDEAQATRDIRLTGVNWAASYGAIGGGDANANYESTILFKSNDPLSVWKSWDLSALTKKWIDTPSSNYGVILWATNEDTDGQAMQFRSAEAASNQPKLEIIWSNTPKTVYFLKDHLGSIRATVLDSATAPVIGYDDYDPWGFPLASRTKTIPTGYLQGVSNNRFTGKERDEEFGLNLDYFGARYYDWVTGRWISVDPLAGKYPGWSPYNYSLNNPIIFIDQDGRDVFIVNDRQGAYGFGHTAILVGNDKKGWVYYSKDGRDDDGRSEYTREQFKTVDGFLGSKLSKRYDEGVRFETTDEQDKAAQEYADEAVKNEYDRTKCNCADFTGETAEQASIKIEDDKTLGVTIPNKQTDKAKEIAEKDKSGKTSIIDLNQERERRKREQEQERQKKE